MSRRLERLPIVGEKLGALKDFIKEEIKGGLKYLSDPEKLTNLKQYIQNANRGSKLTTATRRMTPEQLGFDLFSGPLPLPLDKGKLDVPVGSVPLTEMGTVISPIKRVKEEPFDFDKARAQNARFIPLEGDRTDLGVLRKVNETMLKNPVLLEAGYKYATNPLNYDALRMWASDIGKLSAIKNKAIKSSEDGKFPVYGVFSNMGGESGNYSDMIVNTFFELLPSSNIKKKDFKALDKFLKSDKQIGKKWPGVENEEEARIFLANNGGARIKFAQAVEKAEFRNAGFPDIASIRAATNVDDMLGLGTGDASGRMIAEIDLDAPISDESGHGTYKYALKRKEGTPVYRAANERGVFVDIPRFMLFDDFLKMRREIDAPVGSDNRALSMRLPQQIGASDELLRYLSAQKRGYPYNN